MRDRAGALRTWIRLMRSELRQYIQKLSLLSYYVEYCELWSCGVVDTWLGYMVRTLEVKS